MDRRTLLQFMAAASLAGATRVVHAGMPRVVVAGAGIVGASIAYHLAKAGAPVTIIDGKGPASHASRGTFAWINATYAKQPRHYHALTQESVSGWHYLQAELGLQVRWGGSLEWFDTSQRQDTLASQIAEQVEWGEPARMVPAEELAILEPKVDFSGVHTAAFSGNDGAVDPVSATNLMLAAARRHGARVVFPCELLATDNLRGKLVAVETSCGRFEADKLVLATGANPEATQMFAGVDIPQRSRPGFITITKPMPRLINRIVAAPGVHLHQRSDGRIVLGEQDGAPDNEAHAMRLQGRPNDFPVRDVAIEHGARILAIAEQYVPAIKEAEVEDVFIGWRPLPLDGHPVLGAPVSRPDVYIAIMHSGVSLAPIAGDLAARELLGAALEPALGPYRPDRDFEFVKRY